MFFSAQRTAAGALAAALAVSVMAAAAPAHGATVTHDRIAGDDRYATAVAISQKGFPGKASLLFVASGENFPDALAGGAAAGAKGAPLLLTRAATLPETVKAEITRLGPSSIVVLGGSAAVRPEVVDQLKAIADVNVLQGADRYETAAKVAAYAFPDGAGSAFLAAGTTFPDALAGASAAVKAKAPVLLTRPADLPAATDASVRALGVKNVTVLGGAAAIAASVTDGLKARTIDVKRLEGADRYATAVAVSASAFPTSDVAYVASGNDFPDALSGAALAAGQAPILLVRKDAHTPAVCAEVKRLGATKVVALGGVGAVSDVVLKGLPDCVTAPVVTPVNPPSGCTIIQNYDASAAKEALSNLVAGVRELDDAIATRPGFSGNIDTLNSAANSLAFHGAPGMCAETLAAIKADVNAVYAARDNAPVAQTAYAGARQRIKNALPDLNRALGTSYTL